MRIKYAIYSLICGSILASCLHFGKDQSTTIDYGDSTFIKSTEIDRLWKSSYKYAICFPQNTTKETYRDVAQLIANNQPKFTPKNTIIFGSLPQKQLTGLFPEYSVTHTAIITSPDSAAVAPVIWGTIEAIKPEALDARCNYKIIKRDTLLMAEAKTIDIPGHAIIPHGPYPYFVKSTTQQAWIACSHLDSIWKDDYQYLLVIPKATTPETLEIIEKMSNDKVYSPKNTLICCTRAQNPDFTPFLQGYNVLYFIGASIFPPEKDITLARIKRLTENTKYDYQLDRIEFAR